MLLTYLFLGHVVMAKPQHNGKLYLVIVAKNKTQERKLFPNMEYNIALFQFPSLLLKILNIKGLNSDLVIFTI